MVMLKGWGWLYLIGYPETLLPRPELFVFYQKPWVPLTTCIVPAFQVAAPLPCTGTLSWVLCQY